MSPKQILISGATSGIGLETAKHLINLNYEIIALGRNFSKCPTDHPLWKSEPIDLKQEKIQDAFKAISKKYPKLYGLFCNAGIGCFANLEEISTQNIFETMQVNFISHVLLVKEYLGKMKQNGRGKIIFMGSEAALQGKKKGTIYCASKFAMRGFAQALRQECAKSHIHISTIQAGMVDTPFFDSLSFQPGSQETEKILSQDIAQTVSWILSLREGTVCDEVILSPLKHAIKFLNTP